MRKSSAVLVTFIFVFLFFGSELYTVTSQVGMMNAYMDKKENDPFLEMLNTLAEEPPRTPRDLKQLMLDLQDATPAANQTDFDSDTIYDVVELCIGTDPESNDTDADKLSDLFEIMNGTDPVLPDSNDDGIFDFDEVSITLDLDSDGIPNAWDFDNDGDGVNDNPDLSPHAYSIVNETFSISVKTNGMPTYITIQLVPENPEHLRLIKQSWDWPDGDSEGQMKDLDNSKEDLDIVPYLNVKTDEMPSQVDLDAFGLASTSDGIMVPLSPVYEFGNIVAFNGRISYADTTPIDIDLHAELVWQVMGKTDVEAAFLMADSNYVSFGNGMVAVANVSNIGDAPSFELLEIRETSTRRTVAVKLIDGPYLSVAADNQTLVFNGTSIGVREKFDLLKSQGWLIGFNSNVTCIQPDGTWILSDATPSVIEVIDTISPSTTSLVTYTEPFMITGFTAEEGFGSNVGIFYNTTNKNQTIAANWMMHYRFANNATTTLSDMPGLLASENVAVSYLIQPSRDKYESLVILGESLIPFALAGLPGDKAIQIVIAMEDNSTIIDLSDTIADVILDSSCYADLTTSPQLFSKSLKMNWYNASTKVGLSPHEITGEIITWGEEAHTTTNLIATLLSFNTGSNVIIMIDNAVQNLPEFDPLSLEVTSNILMGGIEIFNFGGKFVCAKKNWKFLNWMLEGPDGGTVSEVTELCAKWSKGLLSKSKLFNSIGKNSRICAFIKYQDSLSKFTRNGRFIKNFKNFEKALHVVGVIVEIGLGIAAGCMIADQIGGKAGREYGATYGALAVAIGLAVLGLLIAIEQIPIIGWLIALGLGIADACGDYSAKLVRFLTDVFYGEAKTLGYVNPNVYFENVPTVTVDDKDGNGVDVGDRLLVNGTYWSKLDIAVKYKTWLQDHFDVGSFQEVLDEIADWENLEGNINDLNYILPHIDVLSPEGSNSVGPTGPQDDTMFWFYRWMEFIAGIPELKTLKTGYYTKSVYEDVYRLYHHYTYAREYGFDTWIEPNIAGANLPITTRVTANYKVANFWWHSPVYIFRFWKIGDNCYHTDFTHDQIQYEVSTEYYDIFPGTLDDFLVWKDITCTDFDGDGLNDTAEAIHGTSRLDYDSDADQLSDSYEIEYGFNPLSADTDSDGVSDWYEHVYETNVTDSDTDHDGLNDYKEIAGWVIDFDYLGNESLPFQVPVTSRPHTNDTDGDSISDNDEYLSNTNPRSNDTNADGIPDFSYAWFRSEATYDTSTEWPTPLPYAELSDICVDAYGDVYTNGWHMYSGYDLIRKYDSSLTPITLPPESYFHDLNVSGYPWQWGQRMEVDREGQFVDKIFIGLNINSYQSPWIFNLTGTDYQFIFGMDADIQDYADFDLITYGISRYMVLTGTVQGPICVYDLSPPAVFRSWGTYGPAVDQFDSPQSIAVDDSLKIAYVCDQQSSYSKPDRVVKYDPLSGTFLGVLSEGYDRVLDVDVDDDGFVYVLSETSDGTSVQKFDPGGEEDTAFRFFGNGTHNFTTSSSRDRRLTVGPDKSIYVLDWGRAADPTTSIIWKFTQDVRLLSEMVPDTSGDWDKDGLTNDQEIAGWDITVNFDSGELTFPVTSNPLMNDSDKDGLGDILEYTLGSNPLAQDSDQDGASDHKEWWLETYPGQDYRPPAYASFIAAPGMSSTHTSWLQTGPSLIDWDTDGDLLRDGIELAFNSSPIMMDTDGDGLFDFTEFQYNSNPNSNDTDNDGASDAQELMGNSSLLVADSDHDLMFDGAEYDLGSSPTNPDQDGDGIPDGLETYYDSDPLLADSDGDGLSDSLERSLWLNVRNSDSDGDGINDGEELSLGSNPWTTDSDYDGVPDADDSDTFSPFEGPVILCYGPDADNGTLAFEEKLTEFVDVIVVSLDELLTEYSDYKYIVLVGRPDTDSYNVERLMYDLLEDSGSILDAMMAPDSHEIAIRHGVWNSTQTVAMLSSTYANDVYMVLQVLKGRDVTILPDYVLIDFDSFAVTHDQQIEYAAAVNSIDTLRTTDVIVALKFSSPATPTYSIARYNESTSPHVLTQASGLKVDEVALHNYVKLEILQGQQSLTSATIYLFYSHADIDLVPDGVLDGVGDIGQDTLTLYYYDAIAERWEPISTDLAWVLSTGRNTTDISIFGEIYAGYVWVEVTDFPLLTLAGTVLGWSAPAPPWALILSIVGGGFGIVAVVVIFRRWRRNRTYGKKMDLFDELLDSS